MKHTFECKSVKKIIGNEISQKCDCDGYHTFDELYEHRAALFCALAKKCLQYNDIMQNNRYIVWKSKKHADGTMFDGMCIVGISFMGEQITYHLEEKWWDKFSFVQEIPQAPEWDKHTSKDVIDRLLRL